MERKLICFDVDGTLRNTTDHTVSPSTIKALRLLKENGHIIVVNTGRSHESFKATGIAEMADWDGYIFNNGQLLLDENEELLQRHLFKPETVLETIRIADSLGMPVNLKMKHRIMTKEPNEYVYSTQRYFSNTIPEVGVYDVNDHVYAMILYGPKGYDYAPYKNVKNLYVAPGMDCYADATIEGITKGTGALTFAWRNDLTGYVAFGDSQNDLEMFKCSDYCICMGNGDPVTKEAADYITDDVDHGGIYNACVALGYIKE